MKDIFTIEYCSLEMHKEISAINKDKKFSIDEIKYTEGILWKSYLELKNSSRKEAIEAFSHTYNNLNLYYKSYIWRLRNGDEVIIIKFPISQKKEY
jgi:hypothetical protein